MKVTDYTHIKASDAKKVVEALNVYLATLHVHYSNLRGHHWHVKGKFFFGVHEKTEELYDVAFEQIDAVAERILMLDGIPVRKYDEILKLSKLQQSDYTYCAKEISEYILEATKVLTSVEREVLAAADAANDISTNDLITGYLTEREKNAWMYTAFLAQSK